MKLFAKKQRLMPEWIDKIEELKSVRILRMKGDLNTFAVAQLEHFAAVVRRKKGYELKHLLLDFTQVTSIDFAAVAALVRTLREHQKRSENLGLVNLKSELQHILWLAKVGHLFPSYTNEADAVKDFETRF